MTTDAIRAMIELKAEHARLWYQMYHALRRVPGADMSTLQRYPAVYTWGPAIAYVCKLSQQGNHNGVLWLLARSRDVNAAMQAMIDEMYQPIEER